jgi:hypothetical protein
VATWPLLGAWQVGGSAAYKGSLGCADPAPHYGWLHLCCRPLALAFLSVNRTVLVYGERRQVTPEFLAGAFAMAALDNGVEIKLMENLGA